MKRLGSFTERYWIPRQHHVRVIALCLIVLSSFTEGTGTIPENFKKKHLRNIFQKCSSQCQKKTRRILPLVFTLPCFKFALVCSFKRNIATLSKIRYWSLHLSPADYYINQREESNENNEQKNIQTVKAPNRELELNIQQKNQQRIPENAIKLI